MIIITDELGKEHWKPDKLPYKKTLANLNVKPNQSIYIGDNIKKDFITAKELGMETVHIERENGVYYNITKGEKYQAKNKVKNLCEIIELYDL